MFLQDFFCREPLSTDLTAEWPHIGVHELMTFQQTNLTKCPLAGIAFEIIFPRFMTLEVAFKVLLYEELLVTSVTGPEVLTVVLSSFFSFVSQQVSF